MQTRALAAALPEKNVLFAFALSAGHREADRVVSIDLKKITIGQLTGATSNKQLIRRIFHGTKYKVVYEPNMEDYLLCHAAFVMPAAFACYKTVSYTHLVQSGKCGVSGTLQTRIYRDDWENAGW